MINNNFNKEKFSEVLKQAIGENRSITDFAKESKVTRTYISRFINCKLEVAPSTDIISKFATVALNGVNEVDLLVAAGYKVDETDFITLTFEPPTDNMYSESMSLTREKLRSQEQADSLLHKHPIKVPVLLFVNQDTIITEESIGYYEYLAMHGSYNESECFYYISQDMSMINARISGGDLVFVTPNKPYQHNDIVVLVINCNTFIRRYKKINNLNLFQAENNEYDSFIFTNAQLEDKSITVVGKVDHIRTRSKL